MTRRNVVLIGATGSIGQSTLRVIERHSDRLRLVGIANGRQKAELEKIARQFQVPHARTYEESGIEGLVELATLPEADIVVMAANGVVGLEPALAAIEAGKDLALASKEILVMAGAVVMGAARRKGVRILPVDSEHNAIFQCLEGSRPRQVKRLILTASGGPFKDWDLRRLETVKPADALRHPNWSMGPKITVDSATMANKGLEMIEARWLFGMEPAQVDVVIHPQSIVHSMVEFVDGSILAQLSPPSMTFAIQHTLLYPDRAEGVDCPLDFTKAMQLSFCPPDEEKFRCLTLARQVMEAAGTAAAVFNAANEVAVDAFLGNKIPFLAIPSVVEHTLQVVENKDSESLAEVLAADSEARSVATEFIEKLPCLRH